MEKNVTDDPNEDTKGKNSSKTVVAVVCLSSYRKKKQWHREGESVCESESLTRRVEKYCRKFGANNMVHAAENTYCTSQFYGYIVKGAHIIRFANEHETRITFVSLPKVYDLLFHRAHPIHSTVAFNFFFKFAFFHINAISFGRFVSR